MMSTTRRAPSLVRLLLLAAVPALLASPRPTLAGGLRCSIGEVVIENLKIGRQYSLQKLANLPLTVTNTTENDVVLRVDPLVPEESELRQGARPIPNGWASVLPDSLPLAAGQARTVDLRLAIPDDAQWLGKKFQVEFWSHTLPRPGDLLSYGLKSRVIFTVDPNRDTTDAEPEGNLSIEFAPGELWLDRVSKGHVYPLVSTLGQRLTLRNTSDKPLTVSLRAIHPGETSAAIVSGFADLLQSASVRLEPATVTLQPGESRTIDGVVQMGRPHERWKSNLACLVSAEVLNQPVRSQLYARIYARTQ